MHSSLADLATKRLQLIFRECLIRRKKDSTLEGRKLIELPPKDYFNPEYQFSEEELEIYNFLQARSRVCLLVIPALWQCPDFIIITGYLQQIPPPRHRPQELLASPSPSFAPPTVLRTSRLDW